MADVREMLRDALAGAGADYCEIRFEESHPLSIDYQGRGLDQVAREVLYGGAVRAMFRGAWGFASFNDPAELRAMVVSACDQARHAGNRLGGDSKLAPVPVVEDECAPPFTLHPRSVPLEDKIKLLDHYNAIILASSPAVTACRIRYVERSTVLHFANSEGTYIRQDKVDIGSSLAAVAREGMTTVSKGVVRGGARGFDCMYGAEKELAEACGLAVRLLSAPQVKAGVYPVVCDPAVAGLFVHEAFGHLSEADNAFKNPALRKTMALGRRLGRDILTIYDSGDEIEHRGYLRYDDEGVRTRRADLIRNGILVGRLHSRETAALMGEGPTGSARAIDYTHPPIVRMRNTSIEAGQSTLDEMVKGIELGLYVVGSGGGQTGGEMFTFQVGHGVMIRNGEFAELVKDVKLMGNVFSTLENIDLIGADVEGRNGPGGCGKGNQGPLPTGGLCPPIRIQNVIVGGAK
ncbi:MAG: TldD/PmbA family protein [Bacillota bacterium]|nr:TldD/PmbA family protein [Bacillota bacterium]